MIPLPESPEFLPPLEKRLRHRSRLVHIEIYLDSIFPGASDQLPEVGDPDI